MRKKVTAEKVAPPIDLYDELKVERNSSTRKRWTPEEIELMIDLYDVRSIPELADHFKVSYESIKSQLSDLKLKRHCTGTDYVRFPGSAKPCEIILIQQLYPTTQAQHLVKYLPGRDVKFVTRTVFKHQVERDDEQAAKVNKKNRGRFKKGQRSWNEGTHYVAGGRSAETRFKKGTAPKNTLPDWATVQRADKMGRPFMMIKVPGEGMRYLSRWTWEQANGPVPQDMLVCHIDNNPLNCEIENLTLRTRAENASINGIMHAANEARTTKLRLAACERRLAAGTPWPGDEELMGALNAWIAKHEGDRSKKISKTKAKIATARKAKVKRIKEAPEKVAKPTIVSLIDKARIKHEADEKKAAEKQAKIAAKAKAKADQWQQELNAQIARERERLAKKKDRTELERAKARRIIEDGVSRVNDTVGRTAEETWLKFEIDHKTIRMVKPSNLEAFKQKYPNAKQLKQ